MKTSVRKNETKQSKNGFAGAQRQTPRWIDQAHFGKTVGKGLSNAVVVSAGDLCEEAERQDSKPRYDSFGA